MVDAARGREKLPTMIWRALGWALPPLGPIIKPSEAST